MSPPVIVGPTIVTVQLESIPETSAGMHLPDRDLEVRHRLAHPMGQGPVRALGSQHDRAEDQLAGNHHLLHVEDRGVGQRAEHARGHARAVDADDGRVEGGVRHGKNASRVRPGLRERPER